MRIYLFSYFFLSYKYKYYRMGGGLMQLVAYGAQDVYLTGNPQITFFKVVYRRHTNFAVEAIAQTFNGTPALGNRVSSTISRNGDLLSRVYLGLPLKYNDNCKWDESSGDLTLGLESGELTSAVGFDDRDPNTNAFSIFKNVEVEIGGQRIDRHTGEWMHLWTLLSHNVDQYELLERMMSPDNPTSYIPLQFWFCRNPGLALPLIALQYHEVKINIEFQNAECTCFCFGKDSCTDTKTVSCCSQVTLWCDYVYLDTDERRRFAQTSHEYLIEQCQFQQETLNGSGSRNVTLNFNHPVKELVWVVQDYASSGCVIKQNYWKGFVHGAEQVDSAILRLNNHDRFARRDGVYFRVVQRYEHHSGSTDACVYLYSFALKPEEHQPSGTCNFSRIDNAQLNMCIGACDVMDGIMDSCCKDGSGPSTDCSKCKRCAIYAVNYNVLRIMSGMGGLAYSN